MGVGVDQLSAGGAVSGSTCGHGASPNANQNKWREQMRVAYCGLFDASVVGDDCMGGGESGAQEEYYEAKLTLVFTLFFQSLLKHSFW